MKAVLCAVCVLVLFPLTTHALPFGFENITHNDEGNAAIGEAQLWVDVLEYGSGQVSFTFYNDGPSGCSIIDVYFDDGPLLGIVSIINSTGVVFSQYANPPNLPGANNIHPAFETTEGFSADSDPPAQPHGVNPGEQLIIVFNLLSGRAYDDVLNGLSSGDLRIGIHVQGFASGGSESFVNVPSSDPPAPVPEPSTMMLLGVGMMLGISAFRKTLGK